MARNLLDMFKYLDKNGLQKLISLVKKGSQEHWIGTQAEYNAQAANIPAGTIVALTDDEDTDYDHGKYALVETVTGKRWYNGKPIYRKVFIGNIANIVGTAPNQYSATSVFKFGDMNVDEITDVDGGVFYGKISASTPPNNQLGFMPFGRTHGLGLTLPGSGTTFSVTDECFYYIGSNATPANRTFVAYVAGANVNGHYAYNPPYRVTVEYTKTTD